MDKQIIFSMSRVSKTLNTGKTIIKDISLSFFYGAKIGVLGLNGSGKSTLLKIIAGIEKNYQGEVVLSSNYTIGLLEQEPELDESKTVIDVVKEGVQKYVDTLTNYEAVNAAFSEPMSDEEMTKLIDRQAALSDQIDRFDLWNLDTRLEKAMDALNCPSGDSPINILSGGERRRVALCRLLLQEPDILLLDEPTNHLDAESVQWLEIHLQQYKGTVIAVTHDRYFLDNVAGWILELDRGQGIPWEGNYSSWLDQKTNRMASEEKQASKRRKTLERELEWIKQGAKGRQSKGKARLNNYQKMLNEDSNQREEKLELFIPNGPRLGDSVIEATDITKAYDDKVLIENFSFKLPPAGIVGIIGPNGAGKTTLFKMIMDQVKPDKGTFGIGDTVKIGYIDQVHEEISPEKTVVDVISGGLENIEINGKVINARVYLSKFNFGGSDQSKKCGVLSGGERNRLHLAMTLKQGANLLLLDEPTNDLDINTLRALEEALDNFVGCAVVISHDRWFLDRICTHIIAYEGDAKVVYFEGGYSDYEENRKKRLGNVDPKRFKYKKLSV